MNIIFRLNRILCLFLIAQLAFFGGVYFASALQVEYWQEILPPHSPPGLAFHGMAYDSSRQVTVLFGGNSGSARVNRTWEYNGSDWSEVFPTTKPSGRENINQAMVYDNARNKVVLFGGLSVTGYVNDTWEYDGSTWSQVNTGSTPQARDAHALVYDSARGKTVLFGGSHPANNYLNDTWEYNGSNWQQVFPSQSPPGRNHHAAAYDSRRGVLVMFGGIVQGGTFVNDTWEFDGTNWQQVFPADRPSARSNHSMSYDASRGVVVLFGGTANGQDPLNETWEYDGTNWRRIETNTAPRTRIGTALAYDSDRQLIVLYGGGYFQGVLRVLDDTWEYQGEKITYLPIVIGARLGEGMPYGIDRGCPSPYTGCGGGYHGFYAGVSTDLVMDAYRAGVMLEIQDLLSQDHEAHPGLYRFGTARHAEDLRSYFYYNQLMFEPNQDYLPGDIAFFDWNDDGLSDHASIISEIDLSGRPLKIVSATGYTADNPSGLARELDWSSYFELHSVGHARLSGSGATVPMTTAETVQALRVRLVAPTISLELLDEFGNVAAAGYDENLVASNVEDYIPYIPRSVYSDLGVQKVITVTNPLVHTDTYFVNLTAQQSEAYNLYLETLQDGVVTDNKSYNQTLATDETRRLNITLEDQMGTLKIASASSEPQPSPELSFPPMLHLQGLAGTSLQGSFDVEEAGGIYAMDSMAISATNLFNQLGETIAADKLSISPNQFNLQAGGVQEIAVEIDLVGARPGWYQGSLLLNAINCNAVTIPLTVVVEPHQRFIPYVNR
ncbi:MAG TPA: kelch repeat-containing protein [Anaerolineales bacterium]|nr:kelch repeat-containing protein [Anaerolineales bacterium]